MDRRHLTISVTALIFSAAFSNAAAQSLRPDLQRVSQSVETYVQTTNPVGVTRLRYRRRRPVANRVLMSLFTSGHPNSARLQNSASMARTPVNIRYRVVSNSQSTNRLHRRPRAKDWPTLFARNAVQRSYRWATRATYGTVATSFSSRGNLHSG